MSLLNVRHFSSTHLWQRTMFNLSYNWNFLRARVKIESEKLINKNYLSIHSTDLDSPESIAMNRNNYLPKTFLRSRVCASRNLSVLSFNYVLFVSMAAFLFAFSSLAVFPANNYTTSAPSPNEAESLESSRLASTKIKRLFILFSLMWLLLRVLCWEQIMILELLSESDRINNNFLGLCGEYKLSWWCFTSKQRHWYSESKSGVNRKSLMENMCVGIWPLSVGTLEQKHRIRSQSKVN